MVEDGSFGAIQWGRCLAIFEESRWRLKTVEGHEPFTSDADRIAAEATGTFVRYLPNDMETLINSARLGYEALYSQMVRC